MTASRREGRRPKLRVRRRAAGQHTGSFILHLWEESGQLPGQPVLWRGSLQHVETGVKRHFQGLEQLLHLIRSELEDSP